MHFFSSKINKNDFTNLNFFGKEFQIFVFFISQNNRPKFELSGRSSSDLFIKPRLVTISHFGAVEISLHFKGCSTWLFARSDNCAVWLFIKSCLTCLKHIFPFMFLFLYQLEPIKCLLLLQNFISKLEPWFLNFYFWPIRFHSAFSIWITGFVWFGCLLLAAICLSSCFIFFLLQLILHFIVVISFPKP